jgi:hypothetical protein
MAALTRPSTATYAVQESVSIDTHGRNRAVHVFVLFGLKLRGRCCIAMNLIFSRLLFALFCL